MIGLLALAAASTSPIGLYAWCAAPGSSLNGIACTAFTSGAIGGAIAVNEMQGVPPPFCIPRTVTQRGKETIVVAYLEKHPDYRGRDGGGIVLAAMREAFPCRK